MFAVGAALKLFAQKAQEVKKLFMIEVDKFSADFDELQETLEQYEVNMRRIVAMNVR